MEVVNCCVFLLVFLTFVRSQTITNVKDLRTYLFTTLDYEKYIRPITKQYNPVDVSITFVLNNVNELNEVDETMTTTGYLIVQWTDDQLAWDPSWFGNVYALYWPQSNVWTPEIAVKNSFGNFKQLGYDDLYVKIFYTGLVTWYPNEVFVTSCTFNVKYFPFDQQECVIKFSSWNYAIGEMFFSNTSTLDMSRYEVNPSWTLESTSFNFNAESYEPQINYVLTLKRRASYTVVSVVLPVILLAILNVMVFSLPGTSGEKIGYAITVFLSLAVFLTIIESSMPKNSQTIPLFSLYMMLLVVQSTIITMLAIFMVKLLRNDELGKPVPKLMVIFTRLMEFRCCKRRSNKVVEIAKEKNVNTRENDILEDDTDDTDQDVTWARLDIMLDRFFLCFFTMSLILLTIVFGAIVVTGA